MSNFILTNSNHLISSTNRDCDWWENLENDNLFKKFMNDSTNYINMVPLAYFLEFKRIKKNCYKAVLYLKIQSYGNRYIIGDSFWDIYMNKDGNIIYINKIIVDGKHVIPNTRVHTMRTVFGNKQHIIDRIAFASNNYSIYRINEEVENIPAEDQRLFRCERTIYEV